MQNKTVIPKFIGLSFSAVLLWKNGLNTLPPLSEEFCKTIFGDKFESRYAFGRNGITVSTPPRFETVDGQLINLISPVFQFGFDRMLLTHPDLNSFLTSYSKIFQEVQKLGFQPLLSVGQMGINIEYEVSFEGGHVQEYFNNRFSTPKSNKDFITSSIGEVKLVLVESNDMKFVNLTIQPRLNKDNAFYIKANDHFPNIPEELFISEEILVKYFDDSLNKFENKVLPALNLFGND